MKERVLYLLEYYLATIALFVVAKVVFMLVCGEGLTLGDYTAVVWHGLSLDLSTALYFFGVPYLLTMLSLWVRVPRIAYLIYYGFVAVVFSLVFVADTSLYPFWHFKLDASCLLYLETPAEAMASVTTAYLVLRFVALTAVTILVYQTLAKINRREFSHKPIPVIRRVLATIAALLLIGPIVVGIRGGLGESVTNIGQVYFSKNQFLNHSAVNPVFSFLSSVEDLGISVFTYDYMTDEECHQLTDSLFYTDSTDADTLLNTQRPNILFIVMESCGGQFTEIGGHKEITPHLNQLAREGVSFSECYANSWRTDKGMVSILSGYPAFPETSIMKLPEKSRKMPSIARSLQGVGYQNTFYYGGDINFTNMRSYVLGTGYDRLTWKSDFSREEQSSSQWGVKDEIMFDTLLRDIKNEQTGKPWMKTLLTLSSHEPWDVPTKVLDDEVYNAFNYLDQCIGRFIDALRKTPAWQHTLVVILPDHGYRYKGIDEATRLYNHIPMLWVGGAVRQPVVIDRLCNQSDLAATLLGQMGINHDDFRFSRDIVSSSYRYPMAYHTSTSCVSLYDSTGWMAYDLDANSVITSEGDDTERLLRLSRALLQLTSYDLKEK
jgi:phosphoglycerol transferase MdoB-like AlkP superfamily enzyme